MAWWHRMDARLRALLLGEREQRELDEEIRFHLDMDVVRLQAGGLADGDAVRVAARRFGDVERIRQAARDARGPNRMENMMQDIRYALRTLRRSPGFTLLGLITLALGISATAVAFTLVDGVLLKPLPYRAPDELVFLREIDERGERLWASFPNFSDWRTQARTLSGVAALQFGFGGTLIAADAPVRGQIVGVSADFFRVLGVELERGREFTAEEQLPNDEPIGAVIVSEAFWRTHLGAQEDLSSIRLSALGNPVQVVGVAPRDFRFAGEAAAYFPLEKWGSTVRTAHNYQVVARLAPGVTIDAAKADMTALSQRLKTEHGDDTQAVDADVMPLHEYVVGDQTRALALLMAAAGLVLLIACVNIVSAQLARGAGRMRELSVRAALGAGRARLIRLLTVESALLATGGALLGLALAAVLLRAIKLFGAGMIPRLEGLAIDARVLAFTIGLTAIATLLVGLYPALRLSAQDVAGLRGRSRRTGFEGRSALWRLLVGFEIALAVLLLIGSGLLVRTFSNILNTDTGLDANAVLAIDFANVPIDLVRFAEIERELEALPGVEAVSTVNLLPLNWGSYSAPVLRPQDENVPGGWPAMAGYRRIAPDYFETIGMPVLRGRGFGEQDREGSQPVAIVTRSLANKLWPGADPIGQQVRSNFIGEIWLTVVGVVPEARNWAQPADVQNEIFVPLAQFPSNGGSFPTYFIARTATAPESLIPAARARLRVIAPDMPAEFITLRERIERSAADRRFAMFVLTGFATVALLLAAVGIYGVMSYAVVARTREIGVRMALGASPQRVRGSIVRAAAAVAVGGILVGLLLGAAGTRVLESMLYGVGRFDPVTFVAGATVLLAAALLAAWVPAWRSSRIDPLVAMRAE